MNLNDIHIIKGEEYDILYYIPTNTFLKISHETSSIFLEDISKNVYSSSTISIIEKLKSCNKTTPSHSNWIESNRLQKLTFIVSTSCNLRCVYCYADAGCYNGYSQENMSTDNAIEYLNFFIRKGIKHIDTIMFFGGEPFLATNTIDSICSYCNKLFKEKKLDSIPTFTAVSNLTQIDGFTIKTIHQHNIHLTVSIDGPAQIHNAQRKTVNKSDTFELTKSNFQKLQSHISSIEATYTMNHVHHNISIDNLRDYLSNEFSINNENILIVPVMNSLNLNVDANKYSSYLQSSSLTEEDLSVVSALKPSLQSDLFCNAGISTFCIMPNGDVYPCHMYANFKDFCFGNIKSNTFHYSKIESKLLSCTKNTVEKCKTCWARKICFLCPAKIKVYNKKYTEYLNDTYCDKLKKRYEYTLRKLTNI